MYRTVVVPAAYDQDVRPALNWGGTMARAAGAELVLLSVRPASASEAEVHRSLRALAEDLGVQARPEVAQPGDPVAALTAAADAPDTLLCMQTRARGALAEMTLGSVSEQVVRRCRQPVLLVGPNCGRPPERLTSLVIALDGSTHSEQILPVAEAWSSELGLALWLFQVLPTYVPLEHGEVDVDESVYVHRLARLLADRGVKAEWETAHSRHVAEVIADFARYHPASVVAMTTHGHSGLGRLAMGSVALQVTATAQVPVLVLRPGTRS